MEQEVQLLKYCVKTSWKKLHFLQQFVKMAVKCHLRSDIHMIKTEGNQILGSKLLSNKQVLLPLFLNMRYVRTNLSESSRLVTSEAEIF